MMISNTPSIEQINEAQIFHFLQFNLWRLGSLYITSLSSIF